MTIRSSTRPHESADLVLRVVGKVHHPGAEAHGQPVEVTIHHEAASLGYRSDYQPVDRYTWTVRFPGDPSASYRSKVTGREVAKLAASIPDILAEIDPTEPVYRDESGIARMGKVRQGLTAAAVTYGEVRP